jgi:hypothetical protein
MSNFLTRAMGLDSGSAATGSINQGIGQVNDTLTAFEGLNLPVKGDSQRTMRTWADKMNAVADLNSAPSKEQIEAMTVLAGGMPEYVKQHVDYYGDAQKALSGLGTIANAALQYDSAVTTQGMQLMTGQLKAAQRVLTLANKTHRDMLLFKGEQMVSGGNAPSLRSWGAQAGGFM